MYRLHHHGRGIAMRVYEQVSANRDSPALVMEAIRSSEMSVLTKNTRREIPEDGFLKITLFAMTTGFSP
jgi:hypothetical protein